MPNPFYPNSVELPEGLRYERIDQPLSRRDYFAGRALTGIMMGLHLDGSMRPDPDEIADFAYKVADAMVERGAQEKTD